jgi:predicted acyl esterase
MFSKTWKISERKYKVVVERNVRIPLSDGTEIDADLFRPDSVEKFPAIFGFHPYNQAAQTASIEPDAFSTNFFRRPGQEEGTAYIEAGDPNAFARRGYVYVIANVRGTGKSGGKYPFLAPPEAQDGLEIIQWIAGQPWCDGSVGMFGVSYFAWIQLFIAALNPPHLKCFFAPWAATDLYRDSAYHGGILGHGFWRMWAAGSIHNCRVEGLSQEKKEAIAKVLQDEDIAAVPELVNILKNPDVGTNPILVDILLHPHDGSYWEDRRVKYDNIKVPGYIGACWGIYGLHLPGAFRSWEDLKVPKRMIIGPPLYLDRPLYQLQYESLRWFDYWLKEIDTGIMEEAPIKLFVMGTNEWKEANEWPLPETKWTPFYLHDNGLLYERECWPDEGFDSFSDSPWGRGYLEYCSPRLVENTEIIGPILLNLYASTTDTEVFWFISLREIDSQGNERILTRGWLRGSHREIDPARSKPWAPFHPHTHSEPLMPGKIYEFNIPIIPTGNLFKAGSKIKLKIACTDDQPKSPLEMLAGGHLRRQSVSRITLFHNADYPSHLLLPITKGNVLETFVSGGTSYL